MQKLSKFSFAHKDSRHTFSQEMLQRLHPGDAFLKHVIFSDEAIFHVSGKVSSTAAKFGN
jgi:hypothetical protein